MYVCVCVCVCVYAHACVRVDLRRDDATDGDQEWLVPRRGLIAVNVAALHSEFGILSCVLHLKKCQVHATKG